MSGFNFPDQIVNQFGGAQQFQQAMNQAQNQLLQQNLTMDQFMSNPQQALNQMVQSGAISQDALNGAIQRASQFNQFFGRR